MLPSLSYVLTYTWRTASAPLFSLWNPPLSRSLMCCKACSMFHLHSNSVCICDIGLTPHTLYMSTLYFILAEDIQCRLKRSQFVCSSPLHLKIELTTKIRLVSMFGSCHIIYKTFPVLLCTFFLSNSEQNFQPSMLPESNKLFGTVFDTRSGVKFYFQIHRPLLRPRIEASPLIGLRLFNSGLTQTIDGGNSGSEYVILLFLETHYNRICTAWELVSFKESEKLYGNNNEEWAGLDLSPIARLSNIIHDHCCETYCKTEDS